MKFIFYLLTILILASCQATYFEELQPNGGKELKEFPKVLQGKWQDNLDGIEITQYDLITSTKLHPLNFSLLSDSVKLMQVGNGYFLNLQDSNTKFWQVIFLLPQKNGDIIGNIVDGQMLEDVNGLFEKEMTSINLDSNEVGEESLTAKPTLFGGKMDAKSFQKRFISSKEYLILKKDGLIMPAKVS